LYSAISFLGLLFVVFVVPETKGRELDEMAAKPPPPNTDATINR
jgi:hypothetical protein